MQHDLPSNVAAFAVRSKGILGSATEIIHQHTILPFFAPFQSPERIQMAVKAMLGTNVGGLKYRLGLVTGRFGAEHPLKACPQCMEEDIEIQGVAYWHLDHQYPGVLVCARHENQLWESCLKRTWSGRFTWCLPNFDELIAPGTKLSSALHPALQLAKASFGLAKLGLTQWFDLARLRRMYVLAILGKEIGYRCGTVPPSAATTSFTRFAADLRPFRHFQALPATSHEAENFLCHLLRNPRAFGHPLRHLTAIVWLFESLEDFLQAYNSVDVLVGDPTKEALPFTPVQRNTVVRESPTLQIKVGAPRPKTLKPPVRRKVLQLLAKGSDKQSVCRRVGVTLSTINKLLRAEPAINQAWKAAVAERECARHRAQWCAGAKTYPDNSTQLLRQSMPSTYAWLYRNDRGWLVAHTKSMPSGRQGNHCQLDWEQRDRELEQYVRSVFENALAAEPGYRLSRSQLYALVPKLSACLKNKERYTRTRELVQLFLGLKSD